jgi:hypothetical protein
MRYVLYVRLAGQWVEADRFDAADHVDAFRKSPEHIAPEHRNCPIAFAPVDGAPEASRAAHSDAPSARRQGNDFHPVIA